MSPQIRNTLVAVLVSAGMLVSFYYLERAFRTGDSKRAIQAVQQTRLTPGAPTVLEQLLQEYGKDARINWIGQTQNNFRGLIVVTCELPDHKTRRFLVDLIHGQVTRYPDSSGM